MARARPPRPASTPRTERVGHSPTHPLTHSCQPTHPPAGSHASTSRLTCLHQQAHTPPPAGSHASTSRLTRQAHTPPPAGSHARPPRLHQQAHTPPPAGSHASTSRLTRLHQQARMPPPGSHTSTSLTQPWLKLSCSGCGSYRPGPAPHLAARHDLPLHSHKVSLPRLASRRGGHTSSPA